MIAACLLATFLRCLLAPAVLPALDRVLLRDGRAIEGQVVPSGDPDVTRLRLPGADISIRNALIDRTWIETPEDYVPRNRQEEEFLARGWVLFEGQWMSRDRREGELRRRAEADRAAIEAARLRQDWSRAVTVTTRHFEITSNLDADRLAEQADRLESYYRAFMREWSITLTPGETRDKPRVFLYRTADDFHAATRQPEFVAGCFDAAACELHVPDDPRDADASLDVLFHEGNHLLVHLMHPDFRYPPWMDEGLAEYYGTARTDDAGRLVCGRPQDGRSVQLRQQRERGTLPRLRDVLLTAGPDFTDDDYAAAWSFVHFLMQSPRHGKAFRSFFAGLPDNHDVRVVRQPLRRGDGAEVGEADLSDVIAALERRLDRTLDALQVEWLTSFDTARGELGARAWYQAAQLELFGGSPSGDGGNVRRAVEDFERAVAGGIDDARCYRDFAELLRKGGVMEYAGAGQVLPPDPARAWDMIRRAIELDPLGPYNYAEAAGILLVDGPVQDLDRAAAMAATALAVAGPRDPLVRALHDELTTLVDRARAAAGPTGGPVDGR